MVRSGDNHCLDIFVVEDGAKILVAFGLPVGQLESAVQIGNEGIGNGDSIDLASSQKIPKIELTHTACANQAHPNTIIGPQDRAREWPTRSKHATRGSSKPLVKVPSTYLSVAHFFLTFYCLCRAAAAESAPR